MKNHREGTENKLSNRRMYDDDSKAEVEITVEMEQTAHETHYKVLASGQAAAQALWDFGTNLKRIRDEKLYLALGCSGFRGYCEERLSITARNGYHYIKAVDSFGVNLSSHIDIGIRKLAEFATMGSTPEERVQAIEQTYTVPSTGEQKKGSDLTLKELQEVKKALNQEKERTKEAESAKELTEELLHDAQERIDELENRPARVEVRTEYIERKPESVEREYDPLNDTLTPDDRVELELFRSRFGNVDDYNDAIRRVTTETQISGSVMGFAKAVRDLVQTYAYLQNYNSEFESMRDSTVREYVRSLEALRDFTDKVMSVASNQNTVTAEYTIIQGGN